jgi:DNA repair protein RadC
MEENTKNKSFTIRELPGPEKPRERLQSVGAENISAVELLAIIMGTGCRDGSVLKTSQRLLDAFQGVKGLAEASVEELCTVTGVKLAKACQIKAAFELAARRDRSNHDAPEHRKVKTPEDAYEELKEKSRGLKKEYFWEIFLDTRSQVIKTGEISVGSLDSSIVHPREVFKEAIAASAASIIAAHNHPSGNPEPSQDDIKLSRRLKEAGELVGIDLVDHIIIGDGKFISLKREGLL